MNTMLWKVVLIVKLSGNAQIDAALQHCYAQVQSVCAFRATFIPATSTAACHVIVRVMPNLSVNGLPDLAATHLHPAPGMPNTPASAEIWIDSQTPAKCTPASLQSIIDHEFGSNLLGRPENFQGVAVDWDSWLYPLNMTTEAQMGAAHEAWLKANYAVTPPAPVKPKPKPIVVVKPSSRIP